MGPAWTIDDAPHVQHQLIAAGLVVWAGFVLWRARAHEVWWPKAMLTLVVVLSLAGMGARLQAILSGAAVDTWWNPLTPGYGSFGLFAGAALGLGLSTLFTRIHPLRMIDVLLPGGLLALGLTRLGCLFRGCDFGSVADFGVRYGAESRVYVEHLQRGLIEEGSVASAFVHPLPVYLGLAAVLGAVVALAFASRSAPGRTAVGAAVYFALRAVFENLRDGSTLWVWSGFNANVILSVVGLVLTILVLKASRDYESRLHR